MRFVQGFEMYRKLAEPVARPNQLGSLLQLAKKAHVTDDAARRLLDQLSAELNHPLIVAQDRRITLTDAGRQLLEVAVKLSAIADGGETPPDVLNVEIAPALAECLLPLALPDFFSLFASLVQLRLYPLNAETVRNNIQAKATSFGVGFAESDIVSSAEMLPKIPWVLALPKNHRLAGGHEPIEAENLTVNDRVFIPELGTDWPGMDRILKAVPNYNRVVCDATLAVRLATSGLGVAVVPDFLGETNSFCKRQVVGVESLQPRFFLGRKGMESLTEPEACLVEQIRKLAGGWSKQEVPAPEAEKDAEDVFEPLVEESVTPMGVLS